MRQVIQWLIINMRKFFLSDKFKDNLKNAIYFLRSHKQQNINTLLKPLEIMVSNPSEFDENCQCNIEWIGSQFLSEISRIPNSNNEELNIIIDDLYSIVYRFLLEFDLSTNFDLSGELTNFISYCQDNIGSFSSGTQRQIEYASKWMHISITKKILNTKNIKDFLEHSKKYDEINQKIDSWDEKIVQRENNVENLSESLKKYETAFNFVGLYKGFDDLHKSKTKEYRWSLGFTVSLGFLTILPLSHRIYTHKPLENIETNWISYFANLIPYIAVTFLILYFFRINYRVMDNIKSQILQIELRKTLCQFVQDYTEFSSDAAKKSPETLKKFESVIFSNIVTTPKKIPSTFDGIESITNLISLAKKSK